MKQLTNQNKKRASAGIGETINCAFKNCSDHFYILKSVSTGTWCAGCTPHTYV